MFHMDLFQLKGKFGKNKKKRSSPNFAFNTKQIYVSELINFYFP